jgi:hypothetical protein
MSEIDPSIRVILRARLEALAPLAERAAWSGDQFLWGVPRRIVATYIFAVHRRRDPAQAIQRKRFGDFEVGPAAKAWVRAEVALLQRLSAELAR